MRPILASAFPLGIALGIALAALRPARAAAGQFEIGASGNYRRTNIDNDAYNESTSITGSLNYYLTEMAAFELSYTDGTSKQYVGPTAVQGAVQGQETTSAFYKMIGIDFIYTLSGHDSALRPYVKAGVAYLLEKRLVQQVQDIPAIVTEDNPAVVPSAGLGFKLSITQSFAIKAGVEGWMSADGNNDVDYAGLVGVAWML